ncbi:MAG: hypothetical protein QW228_09335 [Candidatus Aenigmatarchaeota archaeon]
MKMFESFTWFELFIFSGGIAILIVLFLIFVVFLYYLIKCKIHKGRGG